MLAVVAIFWASMAMGFSGAIMPGPLLTVAMAESIKRGFRAGPVLVAGHAAAELTLLVGLVLGLRNVLSQEPAIAAIGLVGGTFLLWMAYGMVRGAAAGRLQIEEQAVGETRVRGSGLVAGALTSVANPYWSAWWATVGLASLAAAMTAGVAGVVAFYVGHVMSDLIWYSSVSFVVSRGRSLFTPPVYRGVIIFCGALMAGLAIYFLWSGGSAVLTILA